MSQLISHRILGHPLEPFPVDPMRVFNNTPGLTEWKAGNIGGVMAMIPSMKQHDAKRLFYAAMIQSMCKQAKVFITQVEIYEKAIAARMRATAAAANARYPAYPPRVPAGDNAARDV